jgi:hypothetical protein
MDDVSFTSQSLAPLRIYMWPRWAKRHVIQVMQGCLLIGQFSSVSSGKAQPWCDVKPSYSWESHFKQALTGIDGSNTPSFTTQVLTIVAPRAFQ